MRTWDRCNFEPHRSALKYLDPPQSAAILEANTGGVVQNYTCPRIYGVSEWISINCQRVFEPVPTFRNCKRTTPPGCATEH